MPPFNVVEIDPNHRFEDSREEKNDGVYKFDESESKSHEKGETKYKRFPTNALTLVTSRSENSSTEFDRMAKEEFSEENRMTSMSTFK